MISQSRNVRLQRFLAYVLPRVYAIKIKQVLLVSHVTYFVELLYLGKLLRPKYHEFSLKLLILSMLQY